MNIKLAKGEKLIVSSDKSTIHIECLDNGLLYDSS